MGSGIPPIVLMFRDGNGRLWARWPDGQLKRVSPSRWLAKKAPPRKPNDPEPPPIDTLELPDTIEPTPPG